LPSSVFTNAAKGATASLFANLPLLEGLNVTSVEWLSDAVLTTIGERCLHLRCLDVIGASDITAKGIAALAKGCPALQTVYIGNESLLCSVLAQRVWQAFRPKLQFLIGPRHGTRWNNFYVDV
jgi:hypothetical protein